MRTLEFQVSISIVLMCIIANTEEGEEAAEGGDQGVTVIDLVDAHRLKEIQLDKKTWTGYVKGILVLN